MDKPNDAKFASAITMETSPCGKHASAITMDKLNDAKFASAITMDKLNDAKFASAITKNIMNKKNNLLKTTTIMKQINSVNLSAATLGAMTSFYQSVQALIASATPAVLHIEAQAPAYAALVAKLIEVQNRQRAMTTTLNTKQADAQRDAIVGFIYQLIDAMRFSPKEAEALAAARLKLIIASYPKLSQLELERETVQIEGLLRDFSTEQAGNDLNTLKMTEYIELLEAANTAFIAASATRSSEAQARAAVAGGEKSGNLRQQTATAYKQIVVLVNAFAIAIPDAKMDAFIDGVNGEIINLEKVIAVEMAANTRARNKKEKEK